MRLSTFVTIMLVFPYSFVFAAASAAGISDDGMRVMCQQYKGAAPQNTILIFEYKSTGLVEDTNTKIPGVPGTISIYKDYKGEKLYKAKNSEAVNSVSYENILEKVTAPATSVDGTVHLIANKYFVFTGIKNDVSWNFSAGLVVQDAINSEMEVSGSKTGFKCLPSKPIGSMEAKTMTPGQAKCLEDTGNLNCEVDSAQIDPTIQ